MSGLKPKGDSKPSPPRKPRKRRSRGFTRTRMTPTQRVEHVLEQCPDCGAQLSGGWTHRTREVIELPQVPVEVTEHACMARTHRQASGRAPRPSATSQCLAPATNPRGPAPRVRRQID